MALHRPVGTGVAKTTNTNYITRLTASSTTTTTTTTTTRVNFFSSRLLFTLLLLLLATYAIPLIAAQDLGSYEFIVVGAGAGAGVLASRLALAGHRTLLIDAGDDHGTNVNYTVPAFSAKSSEDEVIAWNFFVRHYDDDNRQARDYKTLYELPDGTIYTGLNPPAGARMLGTLYPRSATLGGCTAHHALVTAYPYRSDFDRLALMLGDESWSADNMRPYFVRAEHNRYLVPGASRKGHGFHGWLSTETAPLSLAILDPAILSLILGGAFALGNITNIPINLVSILAGDANADSEFRDRNGGYYQTPLSTHDGQRVGSRELIVAVRDSKKLDGSKRYPLDVRTNCHVTKIIFDESGPNPRAVGVEFLDGAHLYRASPRSRNAGPGVPGSVFAENEVIISGGTYNSPQILKLRGIGPADELNAFGIRVIQDLPGVGRNLQDHYEVAVTGSIPFDFITYKDCTFETDPASDACLRRFMNPLPFAGTRGPYVSNGLPVAMLYRSTQDSEFDVFVFGGPVNFRGYFPGYGFDITARKDMWSWAVLKGHPRNKAGTVELLSADPLDVPCITYNYFETGSGEYEKDIIAIREAVRLSRDAFARQLKPVSEVLPGESVQSDAAIDQYIRDTAWGHHASSTCPMGPDNDPMAVLDSSFRVRGVSGLRVVDASVYPFIPGTFTAVSTYMVGEKAADLLIQEYGSN